jgi:hypothetical protein
LVRLTPRALARVTIPVAQKESLELRAAAPQILHRVGARTTEIAHGFVTRLGHVHRAQFARPVQPRQLARIAPVRLDPIPRTARDQ